MTQAQTTSRRLVPRSLLVLRSRGDGESEGGSLLELNSKTGTCERRRTLINRAVSQTPGLAFLGGVRDFRLICVGGRATRNVDDLSRVGELNSFGCKLVHNFQIH